ncbi:enoyl-CoA hydratase/carnithine racemase [Corynebacterium mustelae]|uniref:3-hydroxyisobutyryl-CoA hydrolase n=1 Tax=Corynebacterium mustelae TaxID=571915 RepID=A0A0G3H2M9_9CORY|nr:3-hydroxyisobutyryl-CoA hydrolase [Corynebacterium mustelae]AKK05377.1 enoyl-CoA hydratase/carnithine racemase [Corynebacterium mustelae]
MTENYILSRVERSTGIFELNRPRALNSLNPEMIDIIDNHLKQWAADDTVTQVIVYSNSEKGFCAGGDVRFAREVVINGTPELADKFFAIEYNMNGDLAHFPKPYIAIIDGVAMGGGLGISAHGSHRVITENAFAAMPEMAIGYIPDVGLPYMLQRMVGERGVASPALALFLVLTGWRLSPADMMWSGLATHFVPHAHIAKFHEQVITDGIDAAVERFASEIPEKSKLAELFDDIEATFNFASWAEIEAALAEHPNRDFVAIVREHIENSSPSAIVAATELMAAAAKCGDIRQELALETALGEVIRREPDFAEGIRAVLVDKCRNPHFSPATFAEVDPGKYRAILKPLTP